MLCCVVTATAQTPAAAALGRPSAAAPVAETAAGPAPVSDTAPAPSLSARAAEAGDVDTVIALQRLPASAVSIVVMDPESGRVLLGRNIATQRSPASTIKLITTFAALDQLGPAFTWHTQALLRGELTDGVLQGDLIVQGGGDPYMTLDRWWGFAHRLRTQGLKSIQGALIIDDTGFSPPAEDPAAFDGRPNRAYNVQPDALMVNFQAVEFHLIPNPATRQVEVIADPAPANLNIDNRVRFLDGRCNSAASQVDLQVVTPHWDHVQLTGALSGSCEPRSFTRVLLTPGEYAYGTFADLWHELGGDMSGGLRIEATPPDARPFLDYESLTLGEIVRLTNKYSNNLMARHLLLTLGRERYGAPATQDKGLAAINDWSRARGLGLEDIDLGGGAGLSRTTHISALQLACVLKAAYHSRYAPEFMASLPLAGLDGTLRTRMKDTSAGAIRLKTGHIDGVSGVAGYVTTAAGKTYILVCLINDTRADQGAGEPVHAALVAWVLAIPTAPNPRVSP